MTDQQKKPSIEIVYKDTQDFAMYACGQCGICYTAKTYTKEQAKYVADNCCMPQHCDCGNTIERGYTMCSQCRADRRRKKEQAQYDRAEKYATQPADSPMLYWNDEYFNDFDEIIDSCATPDEVPEYVYATTQENWEGFNLADMLEDADNNYNVEDRTITEQVTDADELEAFLKEWNRKQNIFWYEADFTRVILRPENYLDRFPDEEGTTA